MTDLPARTRRLGRFDVSAVSLGCMSLSHAYGTPPPAAESARLLNEALDLGGLTLDFLGLTMAGSLSGRMIMSDLALTGAVEIREFAPRTVIERFGDSRPVRCSVEQWAKRLQRVVRTLFGEFFEGFARARAI